MITYQPGKWGLAFSLTCYGSVFPKSFCIAGPCALCCLAGRLFNEYVLPELSGEEYETPDSGEYMTILGSFNFILGFLIVFRSQQAYERWWEGGTLLQQIRGEWFNAYSSLLAFCNPDPAKQTEILHFQHQLARLMSLLYGSALQQVTTMDRPIFELIDLDGFEEESLRFWQKSCDKCEVVLQWVQKLIVEADTDNRIKVAPPILSRVYNELGNGIVNLTNARKITEFPIPFPLAQMVTFMLVSHWFMTCFLCSVFIENVVGGALICFVVVFAFWSINYIALELEMPFGDDLNDLPLQDMQRDFNQSIVSLLKPLAGSVPPYAFAEEHLDLNTSTVDINSYISDVIDRAVTVRMKSCSKSFEEDVEKPAEIQDRSTGHSLSRHDSHRDSMSLLREAQQIANSAGSSGSSQGDKQVSDNLDEKGGPLLPIQPRAVADSSGVGLCGKDSPAVDSALSDDVQVQIVDIDGLIKDHQAKSQVSRPTKGTKRAVSFERVVDSSGQYEVGTTGRSLDNGTSAAGDRRIV